MSVFNKKFVLLFAVTCTFGLFGCSSQPIKPSADSVELSRDNADSDCKEIGRVEGRVSTIKGSFDEAVNDMKLEAAQKGANYIRMETTSSLGTAVSGTAYRCP